MKRLPFAPLERHLEIAALEHMAGDNRDVPIDRPYRTVMARLLGIDPTQLYRWMSYGVTADQADELAVALGLHPLLIWPEWHDVQDRRRAWRQVLIEV